MKYLIDFDRTLFDTDAFVAVVQSDGKAAYLSTVNIWNYYRASDFLYADVMQWLATKYLADVCIVSAFSPQQGSEAEAYQRAKITSSDVSERVGRVVVMEGLKGKVVLDILASDNIHETTVFIDDRLEQCRSVLAHVPTVHCFLIDRSGGAASAAPPPIHHIQSLAEVDVIMSTV